MRDVSGTTVANQVLSDSNTTAPMMMTAMLRLGFGDPGGASACPRQNSAVTAVCPILILSLSRMIEKRVGLNWHSDLFWPFRAPSVKVRMSSGCFNPSLPKQAAC